MKSARTLLLPGLGAVSWENPAALDPARKSAKVTREISARLAQVSKDLETRLVKPLPPAQQAVMTEEIALFLMRCLFTMFAEDVELLPKDCFTTCSHLWGIPFASRS